MTGCGGLVSTASGAIASPNFPHPYPANVQCEYVVSVARGSRIVAHFVTLELDELPQCPLDYVELFDGNDQHSPTLGRYCGNRHTPPLLQTSSSHLFVRFRSDLSTGRRGFLLTYASNCSAVVRGFRGIIESPAYPQADTKSPDCAWRIQLPIGNYIRLVFSDLNVRCEEGAQLTVQQTALNNQTSYDICGAQWSGSTLLLSWNEAVIRFRSAKPPVPAASGSATFGPLVPLIRPNRNRFRLEYYTVGCGGDFWNKVSGELQTPDYPRENARAISCDWHIRARPGQRVQIKIFDFDAAGGQNCAEKYVRVLGGATQDSPELARLCTSVGQQPFVFASMGNAMTIQLHNEKAISWRGFRARFTLLREAGCGGEFTFESGTLHSPGFPASYDPNVDCLYVIRYFDVRRVQINISDLSFPVSVNCTSGALLVYDGEDNNAPLLKQFCGVKSNDLAGSNGTSDAYTILSSKNSLTIRLRGNGRESSSGFKLTYKSVCGGHIELEPEQKVVLTSPNYPHYDRQSKSCLWTVATKPTLRLAITVTHVDSYYSQQVCEINYVSIRAGIESGGPEMSRFCSHVPSTLFSPGNAINVESSRSTFRMIVSASLSSCGADLHTTAGEITSPQYPVGYGPSIQCDWTIQLADSNQFDLQMLDFDLTASEYCATDYFELREESHEGRLIGRFCGSEIPSIDSSSNKLWLRFHSDAHTSSGRGFRLRYQLLSEIRLNGTQGRISSPLHPKFSHRPEKVTYFISTTEDHIIEFEVIDLQLPATANDECIAFIRIREGDNADGVILKELCGVGSIPPIRTKSHLAIVEYVSDGDSLFSVRWSSRTMSSVIAENILNETMRQNKTIDCGATIEIDQPTYIHSPRYPAMYPPSSNCTWILIAPAARKLQLHFVALSIEGHTPGCYFDRLLVFEPHVDSFGKEEADWSLRETVCGITWPDIALNSGTAMVRFESDVMGASSGFRLQARTVCGGRIDASKSGKISYQVRDSSDAANCQWILVARVGRTLKVKIDRLRIGQASPCVGEFLLIRNGGSEQSPLLGRGRYCGPNDEKLLPESSSNQVSIQMHTISKANVRVAHLSSKRLQPAEIRNSD